MKYEFLNRYRVRSGFWATEDETPFGLFFIPFNFGKVPLKVLAAPFDGNQEWEHVSVSLPKRCPTWEEMNFIKDLFWDCEQTVLQFHPPKSQYVNNHPYCLHLWRNTLLNIESPPSMLV